MKDNEDVKIPAPRIVFEGKESLKRKTAVGRLWIASASVAAILAVGVFCFVAVGGDKMMVASDVVMPLEATIVMTVERAQIALVDDSENEVVVTENAQIAEKQTGDKTTITKSVIAPPPQVELVKVDGISWGITEINIEEILSNEEVDLSYVNEIDDKLAIVEKSPKQKSETRKDADQKEVKNEIKEEFKALFRNPNIAGLIESVKERPREKREVASVKIDFANSNVIELFKKRDSRNVE